MHDARYRTVFAFPRMVEDLLRGFAARAWAGSLDFSTLQKVPADYVSDERLSRRGDGVWQVRFHDGRPVLVVLEFQSSDDPRMALRILAYTSLLYQELARNEAPALDELGRLPAVLPVVLYNGGTPWRAVREVSELIQPVDEALAAYRPTQRHHVLDERHVGTADLPGRNLVTAVVRLGRIRSPWSVFRVTRMLRQWLRRPEDDELRRVFAAWMREIAEPFVPPGETLPPEMTLEEIEMTVAERAAEWSKQRIQEGRMRGMREGRDQGVREGMVQGLAHERTLLRRMAASRFGTETAERLAETLAGITDPECLAEIGEWLVRCETGGEFLARVAAAGDRGWPGQYLNETGCGHRATPANDGVLSSPERECPLVDPQRLLVDSLGRELRLRPPPALGAHRGPTGRVAGERPDCKQVVVGLVINRDGFPQAHEIFDGGR